MEIFGTITSRTSVDKITENFTAQKFILDASYRDNQTGNMYENTLEFQVTGKAIEKLAAVPDQARVKVFFNPQGKMLDKKDGSGKFVAMNLNAWKFEILIPTQNERTTPTNAATLQSSTGSVYNK